MLYDRILILCGKAGISIARLERETNLGNGTIRRWKTGRAGAETLKRVADYFCVSVDNLLSCQNTTTDSVQ